MPTPARKTARNILAILWMAICAYFLANLAQGLYEARPDRLGTLALHLFFVLLYLAGMITCFYLLIGVRWARYVLGIVALLTVTASVLGFFAFFNSPPFSFVGIAFDFFALATAGYLFFAR